ncbi:MAG: hypothetical protein AAB356_03215 [Deltaproteobacteria bacterium]
MPGSEGKCSIANCGKEKDVVGEYKKRIKNKLLEKLRGGKSEIPLNLDVLHKENGKLYMVEVKKCLHNHRLQTGIGQLLLAGVFHKLNNYKLRLVFPKKGNEKDRYLKYRKNIEKATGIEIYFV